MLEAIMKTDNHFNWKSWVDFILPILISTYFTVKLLLFPASKEILKTLHHMYFHGHGIWDNTLW